MAETPTYKIELDFPSTSVNAEVPTEQKIRQYDTTKETITTENESVTTEKTTIRTESDNTVTEQEFLSPPIFTVTEKQSSFTKGDMTFQKVTVTEDVSKTNGHKFIRTESQMSAENSRMYFDGNEPGTPRSSESSITYETTEYDSRTEKEGKEKRSKIPMLRLRQAVEKVQNEQRDKKTRNKLKNAPRRSSIPKLKDTKMAIKVDPPPKAELEDEFDKIYEEIVDNKTKDIDNKILTVKIEDPEKIETKFEEIIHAYDEDAPETQSVNKEVLRLSKIPALRKKDDERSSKLGAIVNRVKSKDNVTEAKLKDGGFKISSTKITTKRFSREDSKELKKDLSLNEVENKEQISTDKNVSKMPIKTTPTKPERRSIKKDVLKDGHKVDVTETYEEIEDGTKRTIKKTVITENVEVNIPVNTEKVYHSLSREQSKDAPTIEIFKSVKDTPASRIIKETTIKSTGIPIKSSKINSTKDKIYVDEKADIVKLGEKISREKFAINTTANNGSSETVDIEEYTDENGQKVIKKTIVKEQITIGAPIITERVISEVKSTRTENEKFEIGSNYAESEMVKIEEIIEEEIYSDNSKEFNSITDDTNSDHTNIRSKAKIVKPILTKASNNNSKGQINNVEVNKSIEWKQGNKVQSKTFSRSQSENVIRKVNGNGTLRKSISKIETKYPDDEYKSKKFTGIQDDKPEIITDRNAKYEGSKSNSVVVETKPNSKEHTFSKQFSVRDSEINFRNKEENFDVTDPTENSEPTSTKLIDVTKDRDENTNSSTIDEQEDITQIKGNVSRLINKFVNKEPKNDAKDEGVPKKKTILSKIAIFERVEPLENPLKNNITLERKTTKSISKEITIDQETKEKEIGTESHTPENINENITIDNNDTDQGHSDTPIIVKEIWKFNGAASPLVTSPVIRENTEEVVALEANINENSNNKTTGDKEVHVEYRKQYPNKITPNINRQSIEMPTILPGKMYIDKDENTHETKTLPGNFNFKDDKERTEPTVLSPTNKKTEFSNDKFKLPKTPPNSAYIKSDEFVFEVPKILAENKNTLNTECSENASETNRLPRDNENGFADNTLNSVSTSQDNNNIKTTYKVEELLYPEKITNENITEVKQSKPGKIDFSAWQKQIESNKIRVVKTETELKDIPEKVKPAEKLNERLPGSIHFETTKSKSPAVDKYDTKTNDSDAEEPRKELSNQFANNNKAEPSPLKKNTIQTWEKVKIDKEEYKIHHEKTHSDGILVDSVQAIHHNSANKEINIDSDLCNKNVNQLTLTPNVPEKIDSEYSDTETNKDKIDQNKKLYIQQVEAINLLPGKIEHAVNVGVLEKHKILPGKLNLERDNKNTETPKRLPGKLNLDAWQNKVELNREKVGNTDSKDNEILELNNLSGKRFKPYEAETALVSTQPQKQSTNESVNDKIVHNNTDLSTPDIKEQVAKTEVEVTKVDTNLSDSNETLSDPELIDEENVVIQNNLTVVGKIKPMVYYIAANKLRGNTYITNKNNQLNEIKANTVELKENKVEQESAVENKEDSNAVETGLIKRENRSQNGFDLQNGSNETYDNVSSEYTKDKVGLNTRLHKAQSSVTLDKTADEFENRENVQRAKSLAELDLGDVVKGKVQKMVVRMSSLDFEKQMDWEPKRKISIKEMPKKLSVLEKIALFEGKATPAITNPPRNKPLQLNTPPIIPEEVYLQKIEELQTAKLKFGKFEDMLYWKMDNGGEIPVLAIGTAMLDKRLIQPIVSAAIDMGYRAIDTAFIYGNEKEVGQAIRDKIKEGVVRREDLFIMSKLWSTFHRPDLVEKACRQSLEAMGLEYFDLYMIHNPMSFKEGGDPLPKIANILQYSDFDYLDAWYGMEDLVHKGLVKAIGVSNFNSQQLQRILNKGKIKPVVNQVECHPYLTQQRLRDFCSSKNIILSCFGTLGSKGTPAELTSGVAVVADDPLVQVMASGLGVSTAQMLIRYQIDNGNQVVVKASTAAHLWDNLQALMFTLDSAHVDALDALNRNKRIFTFKGMGDTHKNYPFKTAF